MGMPLAKFTGAIDGVDDPFESTVGFDLTCFFAEDEMIGIMMPDDIHDGLFRRMVRFQ